MKKCETKILRETFRPKVKAGEGWVEYRKRTWREMSAEKEWTTMAWATHDGDFPVIEALRSILRWKTTSWWRIQSAWDAGGSHERIKMETSVRGSAREA